MKEQNFSVSPFRRLFRAKCAALTVFLIAFLIADSLLSGNVFWDNLLWCVFYFSMIFAPWFVHPGKRLKIFTFSAGSMFLLLLLIIFFSADPPAVVRLILLSSVPGMCGVLLFECVLTGTVLYYAVSPGEKTNEPLAGCVLAYLLAAIVFADVYWLCARDLSCAFAFNGHAFRADFETLLYFSFATLTTCGFGDVTPLHPFVRILSALEGVLGVLYVALFIGRMLKLRAEAKSVSGDRE